MSRTTVNPVFLGEALRGDHGVAETLEAKGARVLAAAEAAGVLVERGADRHPMPYEMRVHDGPTRITVQVAAAHYAGLNAEAKYHTLTRAMDAAAG